MNSRYEKKEPKNILRLISLFLALLMWINFSGRVGTTEPEQRIITQVPLIYDNQPDGLKIRNEELNHLNIHLSGPARALDALTDNDLQARLDLTNVQPGYQTFPLSKENITLLQESDNVEVASVSPATVTLQFESYSEKSVPITLDLSGNLAPNYKLVDYKAIPDSVLISGPSKDVENLIVLSSQTISIKGATESFDGPLQLAANQLPRNAYVVGNTPIRFEVTIAEQRISRDSPYDYTAVTEIVVGEESAWLGWQAPELSLKLQLEGPVTVMEWFDDNWVVPVVKLASASILPPPIEETPTPETNEENPGEEQEEAAIGPQSPEPKTARFVVETRWRLPAEVMVAAPDWLERVNRLTLTWSPDQLEVSKP